MRAQRTLHHGSLCLPDAVVDKGTCGRVSMNDLMHDGIKPDLPPAKNGHNGLARNAHKSARKPFQNSVTTGSSQQREATSCAVHNSQDAIGVTY